MPAELKMCRAEQLASLPKLLKPVFSSMLENPPPSSGKRTAGRAFALHTAEHPTGFPKFCQE